MTKTVTEPKPAAETSAPPPLNAGVRRHLGKTLRNHYADALAEPIDARLEALIARLGQPGS